MALTLIAVGPEMPRRVGDDQIERTYRKRRANAVGIFPNEASIIRLIGAVLLEQNDEWQLQHRYMQVEAMAELFSPANEQRQLPSAA
jgi:hypothetical protein